MSRAVTHRSSEVEFNGKLLFTAHGHIVASAAAVSFGHFVSPCTGKIKRMLVNTVVAPTHATSDLSFGKASDPDSHINEIDWQNHAVDVVDLVNGTEGTDPYLDYDVVEGEAYAWVFTGGDTTGELYTTIVVEPA